MAEKKFAGAPFGTQTARFDVTGVHPKNKLPGSFTQMPYDKYSMVEQKEDQRSSITKVSKIDACLQNIRHALKSAKKDMDEIESLRKIPNEGRKKTSKPIEKLIDCSFNISTRIPDLKFKPTEMKNSKSEQDGNSKNSGIGFNQSGNSVIDTQDRDSSPENIDKDGVHRKSVTPSQRLNSVAGKELSFCPDALARKEESSKTETIQVGCETDTTSDINSFLTSVSYSLARASVDSGCSEDGRKAHPKIMKMTFDGKQKCYAPPNSCDVSHKPIIVRMPIQWKKREKRIPCDVVLKRKLGPGTYNTVVGGFSSNCVETRASGPGWARQLEVERLAALPHLLYKEQWEENKMLKRKLGPGSYEIKDFVQTTNLKPTSHRGICENLAPRFDKGVTSFTPGPGTYGIGGVPQRAMEDKNQQSISTKGMLDSGDRKRTLPSVGSHLGPGTYRHKTCTDEMLHKVTSLKGPYELYSGDRNKPISEGYQAAPKLADLGPGQYEIGSFVDELHGTHKKSHGVFGKMVQYPEVPTERLFLFSKAHCPKKKDIPGPGAYSMQDISKPQAVGSPGFLSSAKRDDKLSQKFFTRNFNPVGAGRYDIQKFHEAQDVNGHSSVFRSKTGKPGLHMAKFLQERIRAKDVPVQDRMFITEPGKPGLSRSITVM